jgi:hypothetical protein
MKWIPGVLAMVLSSLATVQAHRLSVDWSCADGMIEILATAGTDPAAGAEVQVRDASGRLVVDGILDGAGRYRWPITDDSPLTIEINAGLGHRRTLTLTADDLRSGLAGARNPRLGVATNGSPSHGDGSSSRGSSDAAFSEPVRVGLGLTFLLALAAAWMGYRNSRRLTRVERRMDRHES